MKPSVEIMAKKYGALEMCKSFEADLLKIKDVVPDRFDEGIPFDLSGFLSDIKQVIIVPKYNIRADRDDYWDARTKMCAAIVDLAEKYDLHRTDDRIEDYGEHFYFVFSCGSSWIKFWEAKQLIEHFAEKQQGGHFACPRCGRMLMNDNVSRNALSRRASVQVCDCCGIKEALDDLSGKEERLTDWAIVMHPELFCMDMNGFGGDAK